MLTTTSAESSLVKVTEDCYQYATSELETRNMDDKAIKAALPGETLNDDQVRGLSLRAFPESKQFYLYYRTKSGQQRRPKLGEYGPLNLAQARKMAREWLLQVAAGGDPAGARLELRNEPTVADLWDEFKKRHVDKMKSAVNYERAWRLHVEPRFGRYRVKEVTYQMVADMHDAMSQTTPTEANRVLVFVSAMFNFAIAPLKWTLDNPTKGVKRNREVKRKRYMAGDEAARIAEILHAEADRNPQSVAFLYLLILTGARKGEIAKAKWSDLQGNRLALTEHKTDRTGDVRYIYLPPAAMDVLDKLPRTSGTITGILTPQKLWERIRVEAGCEDLRMHDLRHSFASAAISAGLTLAQIGELLGHKSTQTTHRYAHLVEEAANAAATMTADKILERMKVSA